MTFTPADPILVYRHNYIHTHAHTHAHAHAHASYKRTYKNAPMYTHTKLKIVLHTCRNTAVCTDSQINTFLLCFELDLKKNNYTACVVPGVDD